MNRRMSTLYRLFAIPVALAVLASCGPDDSGNGDDPPVGPPHQDSGNSWTVLVYMVADNNLELDGLDDLEEMARVGSAAGLNIVVQVDRAMGYVSEGVGNLPDWQSTKRLLVHRDSFEELDDLGELNMGDPNVLTDFLTWGISSFPADRYALIFWDHGAGWPGFGGDESTADHDLLSLAELRAGIDNGMLQTGLEQFALIGFDACLMASYEVATSMSDFGEYLLASEELEPGHGWDYESLRVIHDDTTRGPIDLGMSFMSGFSSQAAWFNTGENITLSLVDLYALRPLQDAVAELAGHLRDDLSVSAPHVARQRLASLRFGEAPDPRQSTHMLDIGDFAARLTEGDSTFGDIRDRVQSAMDLAVVAEISGPVTTRASGLSIYFPPQQAYYDNAYAGVASAQLWNDMLMGYFGIAESGSFASPTFTNPNRLADYEFYPDGLVITGTLAAEGASNLSRATLSYGMVDQNSNEVYLFGDESAGYDNQFVDGFWDYTALVMEQGPELAYLYMSLEWTAMGDIRLAIPFEYQPPGGAPPEYVLLVYILDGDWNLLQETYYLITDSGPGELNPQVGSTLYPIVRIIDVNGNFVWGYSSQGGFDPFIGFSLSFEPLPTDTTIYAELSISDLAGSEDFVYFEGLL